MYIFADIGRQTYRERERALQPFDDLRYDLRPTCALLLYDLNKRVSVMAASGLCHCELNDL